MKKIISLPIALAVLSLAFQSCSTSKSTLGAANNNTQPPHKIVKSNAPSQQQLDIAVDMEMPLPVATSQEEKLSDEVLLEEKSLSAKSESQDINPKVELEKMKEEAKLYIQNLSKSEKKQLKKEIKSEIKKHKSNETTNEASPLLLAILSIIFPLAPLMMYLYEGEINERFWISLILTLLFYIPAIVYNFIVMLG